MSVRRPSHRSLRSRRNRSVSLFPEALENRVVLSTSSDALVAVPSVLMTRSMRNTMSREAIRRG